MKMNFVLLTILAVVLMMPMQVGAETIRAGSDDYLRQKLGYTDEMLQTEYATELREKFERVSGQAQVDDPLGDVLDRFGVTSSLQVPWADIESVEVKHNTLEQAWEVRAELGALLPQRVTQDKAQLFFFVDSDGASENNDYDGTGADMDKEFSLQYNADMGWYTDYKWYNQEADFWGLDQTTEAGFLIEGNVMTLFVPFDEVPYDAPIQWRVIMAVQKGPRTQIDVAPGVGFPPPQGETYPDKWQMPKLSGGLIVLIVAGLIALIYGLWAALSGRMKSCKKEPIN